MIDTISFFLFFISVSQGGQLKAVVGASGGSLIIAGTAEVLLNHLARGMDPLSSVLAPRSYHQVTPNHPDVKLLFLCYRVRVL